MYLKCILFFQLNNYERAMQNEHIPRHLSVALANGEIEHHAEIVSISISAQHVYRENAL